MKCKNCEHPKGKHDVEYGSCNVLIRDSNRVDFCPCVEFELAKVSK